MDYQSLANANNWSAIMPEIALGLLALGLLVLEIVLPRRLHAAIPRVALVGQVALLAYVVWAISCGSTHGESFGGLLKHSGIGDAFRVFFLIASSLVTWMGIVALERQALPRIEFFHIVLVVTGAMMLLVQSHHFVMLFVALETVTVGFYVLVSYFRTSASLEAGLKYLILGALSSALLTFGIVLLYGVAGNSSLPGASPNALGFDALHGFLALNGGNTIAIIGMILVLCGVAFKIGAVPFQIWIPDVYQGASTPVTAFLAVSSKAAGFGVLLNLVTQVFPIGGGVLLHGLVFISGATILFGNLAALTQRNTKRLMGLSGISHAGYLLLGVAAATQVSWAAGAVVFYLFIYMAASMGVFGVLTHLSNTADTGLETDEFVDLGKRSPLLGAVLAVSLGSLAGIPPLAGFIGKVLLFIAAFKAGLYGLLGVAIVGVILSIYYYFGWIKMALFEFTRVVPRDGSSPELEIRPMALGSRVTLSALALATLVLGFFQGPVSQWLDLS